MRKKTDRENDLFVGLWPVVREYAQKRHTKHCPNVETMAMYLDGGVLSPAEIKMLKKHILSCPYCAVAVLELQMAIL